MTTPEEKELFMVIWDDEVLVCCPMSWDESCEGAIRALIYGDSIAIFKSKKEARKSINISRKWNQILKAQGKPYSEDFDSEYRKNLKLVKCSMPLEKESGVGE